MVLALVFNYDSYVYVLQFFLSEIQMQALLQLESSFLNLFSQNFHIWTVNEIYKVMIMWLSYVHRIHTVIIATS
jgi:hypothetical protein